MLALQQKNQPLSSILTYFDQLLVEAGGADWPEQTKISLLRKAVNKDLILFLVSRPTTRSYNKLKESLREIDNNAHLLKTTNTSQKFLAEQQQATRHAEPMELNAISVCKQQAKWVSSEEIQRPRNENLCLRIGAIGHRVKTCPYLAARRPFTEVTNVEDSEQLKE